MTTRPELSPAWFVLSQPISRSAPQLTAKFTGAPAGAGEGPKRARSRSRSSWLPGIACIGSPRSLS
jgi:hypothetical protein